MSKTGRKTIVVACAIWVAAGVAVAQTADEGTGVPVHPDTLGGAAGGAGTGGTPAAPSTQPYTPPGSPAGTQVRAVREGEEQAVASYVLQLRELEQRINQLKQEVFRSKARLAQLAETVIQGSGSGRSKIKLMHKNEMSGTFQMVKLVYFLDRSPVYSQTDDSGELGELDEISVYESIVAPGDHTISVEIEYRGYGHGIFSYLQGYRFRVNSSHTVTIAGGKEVTIQGIGFEQGDPLTAIEERPTIRFTEQIRDLATGMAGGQ